MRGVIAHRSGDGRGDGPAVARCIEQHKPVGTTYRLRVKAPKKKEQS
jgi:hypothetical protein